jgi:hypothetical protein
LEIALQIHRVLVRALPVHSRRTVFACPSVRFAQPLQVNVMGQRRERLIAMASRQLCARSDSPQWRRINSSPEHPFNRIDERTRGGDVFGNGLRLENGRDVVVGVATVTRRAGEGAGVLGGEQARSHEVLWNACSYPVVRTRRPSD